MESRCKMLHTLRFAKYGLLMLDLLAFLVSYQLGHLLRRGFFYESFVMPGTPWFLPFLAGVFLVMDVYNPWSHYSRMGLATRMLPALLILTIVLSLVAFLVFGHELQAYVGRSVLYFALGFFGIYAVSSRFVFARVFDQAKMQSRWLILTEKRFLEPIDKEVRRRFPMWEVVFMVRDSPQPVRGPAGEQVLPMKSALPRALESQWDGVIIATEALSGDQMELLLSRRMGGLRIFDLVSFYERYFLKVPLYVVAHSHFMISRGFFVLSNPIGLRLKTVMDYTIAAFLLIGSVPFMLMIAAALFIDSGRPILFRQERTGISGQTFSVFKFRTMIPGADKQSPYTQEGDSRVTRFGRILRLSRLDELPQLINILMGQMSLIGPRAEWTKLTQQYERQIPFYNLRHLVRPGLTGWAQVMYPYGANIDDTVHKLEYDLYYIKNYTALLDINILLKTVRVVLFGGGR
ncbi:exopolysaccharide biosynthesis polyprenyl glycosylphosphotransferase [Leptonema illini]|uniref:exopolysaccharide biosynthesis polyprenyl glycosylphosphotransferase n=1 Tax=Leptonema illini TaxID=183 RepID=UPI00099101D7|nr:exopolysaccharide biosynthesis polyprenyl glycosylphosphotransferase [Leptonema illini]